MIERLKSMGITDPNKVYDTDDLAPGKKIIFAATGVTDGRCCAACASSARETHALGRDDDRVKTHSLCR